MFNESNDLNDHINHDPSSCDFARMLLIHTFIAGTHVETVSKLTKQQIFNIGIICAIDASNPLAENLYATYGLTLTQVFDFSEYLRNILIQKHGLLDSVPQGNPRLN
jgi:hypothetical protein